jgi:chromosome segregation ATPase
LLLSKASKLQQENEDKKNEFIINDLEKRIETLENSLKEKDSLLNIAEGSLTKARLLSEKQSIQISEQDARIEELNKELEKTKSTLQDNTSRFNHEAKVLNLKVKVNVEKNFKLCEALKTLRDKCFGFATHCSSRLRSIFNFVGATSEEANHSAKDIPKALEWIEREIDDLDEVIVGHGDFCALVGACGTTTIFAKAGCNHLKTINKSTFGLSPLDLDNIPAEARSVGYIFITQI